MKINKYIEIVSSTKPGLSSMGKISRAGAKAALDKHYKSVGITIVNAMSDLQALVARKPDLVFLGMSFLPVNPNLGREDTEKIWLTDYLERHGIAHTGSDQAANFLESNKHFAKQKVTGAGFRTSPFYVAFQDQKLAPTDIQLSYPLFIKPTNRGGGLGIDDKSLVYTFDQLQTKVRSIASKYRSDSLIEQYLPGREFSVAILRQEDTDTFLAMPLELIAPSDQNGVRILSGNIKSSDKERFGEVGDKILKSKITRLALGAFHSLGARDYGRIDIRLDTQGQAHFLEANLLPSLLDGYGNFPKACWLNNKLDYESMLLTIVRLALDRSTEQYDSDYISRVSDLIPSLEPA